MQEPVPVLCVLLKCLPSLVLAYNLLGIGRTESLPLPRRRFAHARELNLMSTQHATTVIVSLGLIEAVSKTMQVSPLVIPVRRQQRAPHRTVTPCT